MILFFFSSIRRQRIISAPTNSQKPVPKKLVERSPPIEVEDDDDALSASNDHSYTEATSSSSFLIDADENQQCARQSMLHTLMLHWNSHPPSDMSKWEAYQHFGDKFSASISASVYRSFERIMLWQIRLDKLLFCSTIELNFDSCVFGRSKKWVMSFSKLKKSSACTYIDFRRLTRLIT